MLDKKKYESFIFNIKQKCKGLSGKFSYSNLTNFQFVTFCELFSNLLNMNNLKYENKNYPIRKEK